MSLFKRFFGFDQSDIESNANAIAEIEKHFPDIITRIKQLESQNIGLAEQMNQLKEIYGNVDQKLAPLKEDLLSLMETVSENTKTIQEHNKIIGEHSEVIAETSKNIADLTEKVGNSDQVLIVCSIMASVAAITAFSFIAYCIYQSTRQEKEKKNESFSRENSINSNTCNVCDWTLSDSFIKQEGTKASAAHSPRGSFDNLAHSSMIVSQRAISCC